MTTEANKQLCRDYFVGPEIFVFSQRSVVVPAL